MFIWTLKLFSTVRRAIAGRRYPAQLAWGVALGTLLGIVPHGNLTALLLLLLILSLRINHAMAGLTAVGVSFAATHLDPYSHQLGDRLLTDPDLAGLAAQAWSLPLAPWTHLNNTVVLGSLLIGIASVGPIFLAFYPLFRWLAPSQQPEPDHAADAAIRFEEIDSPKHQIVLVDRQHRTIAKPHPAGRPAIASPVIPNDDQAAAANLDGDSDQLDPVASPQVPIETRIDVIRMKDYRDSNPDNAQAEQDDADSQQPMDEALNYLLRQLRDSQQRKVA